MTDQTKNEQTPPANAKRVYRVADLPQARGAAKFEISNDGDAPKTVTLSKRQRQILELLSGAPVFCASPVRLSDVVHILKREIGLQVETRIYPGDPITGSGDYGVYFLRSRVRSLHAPMNAEAA